MAQGFWGGGAKAGTSDMVIAFTFSLTYEAKGLSELWIFTPRPFNALVQNGGRGNNNSGDENYCTWYIHFLRPHLFPVA